jgi:hypothetical protein
MQPRISQPPVVLDDPSASLLLLSLASSTATRAGVS